MKKRSQHTKAKRAERKRRRRVAYKEAVMLCALEGLVVTKAVRRDLRNMLQCSLSARTATDTAKAIWSEPPLWQSTWN